MKPFARSFLVAFFVGLLASACLGVITAAIVRGPDDFFMDAGTVAAMCGVVSLLVGSIVDRSG